MKYPANNLRKIALNRTPVAARSRPMAAAFWLAVIAGLAVPLEHRAAGSTAWRESRRSGMIISVVPLRAEDSDGRNSPASPVSVTFPEGYQYCRHHFDYRGWVGRGMATVVSAAPGRMAFGISVHGGNGPLDQGHGAIAVTVEGIAVNRNRDACTPLPVIGDEVSVLIRPWVFDENDKREVQWVSAYPDPGFSADPGHAERVNGRWQGGYHWEGNRLCLEINNLSAPEPSDRRISLGYAVTLKGARFSDGDTEKTLKLYSYRGMPDRTNISQCFPVRR